MSYPFEDLDPSGFERLIVQISRQLFGPAVSSFATGPDGGRDARFDGTAANFPSINNPWSGTTIIQAKHTNALNAHFNDPDFSGDSQASTLTEELVRIKRLHKNGELHHYLLAANRRLGGNTDARIKNRIADETGLARDSVHLIGIERLNDFIHENPDLTRLAQINPADRPLLPSSHDLAEVVLNLAESLKAFKAEEHAKPVDRTSLTTKNQLNGMSPEYSQALMRLYAVDLRPIKQFLAHPANEETLRLYEASVDELGRKVAAYRKDFGDFDKLYDQLVDSLFARDGVLTRNKRLTRVLLFYMYYNCDIGEVVEDDVAASQ